MLNTKEHTNFQRTPMEVPARHRVKNTPLQPPFPSHLESVIFGRGCFWGVEATFWGISGVYTTAVGYAGGTLEHPTYSDVCGGETGHTEVVLVVYDPGMVSFEKLLDIFWKGHRPYQSSTQKANRKDQYRSVIFTTTEAQRISAVASRDRIQQQCNDKDVCVATEVSPAPVFYYAEARHQQYSAR